VLATPVLPTYRDDDDDGPKDRRAAPRGLIVLVVLLLLLSGGVGGVYLLTRDDAKPAATTSAAAPPETPTAQASEPAAGAPPSSAQEPPATTAPAAKPGGVRPWATRVIGIVRRSAPGRQASIRAAASFTRCDFSATAFADVETAIAVRRQMLAALGPVDPPNAAARRAQRLLVQSLRQSIAANRARAAAARTQSKAGASGTCSSGQPNASDRAASTAKAAFVAAFTPLARGAKLKPVAAADI
jgi:hypothetical protein